jgi:hypothetical protein
MAMFDWSADFGESWVKGLEEEAGVTISDEVHEQISDDVESALDNAYDNIMDRVLADLKEGKYDA